MPRYSCEVFIRPRADILDPQGDAVSRALTSLGFSDIEDLRVGRYIFFHLDAAGEVEARSQAESMCQKLLANPVTEDFDLTIRAGD